MLINFQKWHGLGNDFVIIDNRDREIILTDEMIIHFCNRNIGIGCDQLILINKSPGVDCEMLIYNKDSSISGACGNATRCVVKILGKAESKIRVGDRILSAWLQEEGIIKVDMGEAISKGCFNFPETKFPEGNLIDVGNEHLVFFVDESEDLDIQRWGAYFENHNKFTERVNVQFAKILSDSSVSIRIWEKGVGETLACGSGACAVAFAGHIKGLLSEVVKVDLKGGKLSVEIFENKIFLSGEATKVFDGIIIV
jgi:diaminopimelate epimerase